MRTEKRSGSPARALIRLPLLAAAAAALLALAGPSHLSAQAVVRIDRATMQLPVVMNVGTRLHTMDRAPARFTETVPAYAEVEITLRAAANVDWTLVATLPAGEPLPSILAVQNAAGEWEVPVAGAPIRVTTPRSPTNPVPMTVRVRIARGVPAATADRLELRLQQAATTLGN